MPSEKPRINFITNQKLIDKMKFIAAKENRSMSKEIELLCKKRIEIYEKENGEKELELLHLIV